MASKSKDILEKFDLYNPDLHPDIDDNAITSGDYPYNHKMDEDDYDQQLLELQIELVKLQKHISETGDRIILIFEGRDTAGKGGTIKRFMAHMNPRYAHVIALPKPNDTELGQWYFQRYITHLPTKGHMTLFDRSWYNRAGVEPVMGFCTSDQQKHFLKEAPKLETMLVHDGFILVKFWLTVGQEMQLKRLHARQHDPLKTWKLSPIDLKAIKKWDDYTKARDLMFDKTHKKETPWTVIRSNDKRRARLAAIRHVLQKFDYKEKNKKLVKDIDEKIIGNPEAFFKS